MDREQEAEGTRPAEEASAAAIIPHQAPAAPANVLEQLEAVRQAAALDWTQIDLELPQLGFVVAVGGEVQQAAAVVACECGTRIALELDGESRARCPNCKAVFRHVLLVQREDHTPSTASLFVAKLLEESGLRS